MVCHNIVDILIVRDIVYIYNYILVLLLPNDYNNDALIDEAAAIILFVNSIVNSL
jgi:hypothetical protein